MTKKCYGRYLNPGLFHSEVKALKHSATQITLDFYEVLNWKEDK